MKITPPNSQVIEIIVFQTKFWSFWAILNKNDVFISWKLKHAPHILMASFRIRCRLSILQHLGKLFFVIVLVWHTFYPPILEFSHLAQSMEAKNARFDHLQFVGHVNISTSPYTNSNVNQCYLLCFANTCYVLPIHIFA